MGIGLSFEETEKLLNQAGYAFSNSLISDLIVKYFLKKGEHDIFKINEVLFNYDQKLLGYNNKPVERINN